MRNIQLSMQYQGNHYAENAMTIAIGTDEISEFPSS